MLGILTVDEADAILAHEMAHFSGEDTTWSRRISPMTGEMRRYLFALHEGGLTRPVFHFIHLFWKLYHYSLGKMSRAREFRADRLSAENVSPDTAANALVKVSAYCEYRSKTEDELMSRPDFQAEIRLAESLASGFSGYLGDFVSDPASALVETAHPFDTHPTLAKRLEALGKEPSEAIRRPEVLTPVSRSWRDAVSTAPEIEERLWTAQESAMQEFHEANLTWTLSTDTPENLALVEKHFPPLAFQNKKGKTASLSHAHIRLDEWPGDIRFADITDIKIVESYGTNTVTLKHLDPGLGKTNKAKFVPALFTNPEGNLFDAFTAYYSRYKNAEEAGKQTSGMNQ